MVAGGETRLEVKWSATERLDHRRQLSGSQAVNVNGSWGARGAADPGNVPGARYAGQAWTAASSSSGFPTQQLWLFGGFGQDRDGAGKYLSDLWRFDLRWTG
eukprot:COSAG04_NODE_162_length_21964_cov_8.739721_12_plen_102_part_00